MKAVSQALQALHVDVVVTREPGGTDFGEMVRGFLLDPAGPDRGVLAEAFLYSACRAELVQKVIVPALKEGKVVLVERFVDSTIVYQGYAGGIPIPDIESISRIATEDLVPDLTLVFDIDDPVVFDERLAPKNRDKIELRDDEYHARVRQGYRDLAERFPNRIRLIDGAMPRDEVERTVLREVLSVLRERRGGETL